MFVAHIDNKTAMSFYKAHHYAKGVARNASSWGAYQLINHGLELVACCSFATPISEALRASLFGPEHKDRVKELQRLARSPLCGFSMSSFLSVALKRYGARRQAKGQPDLWALVSFADMSQGHHGGVYQAMSWLYCGSVTASVDSFTDETGRLRHRRQNGHTLSAAEALAKGWTHTKVKSTKHRYVKILGTKRQRKARRSTLLLSTSSYPKPQREQRSQV